MEYEFYLDLFFLIDVYFNLLSLFLSAALLRYRRCVWRLCLSAVIGSFWNCVFIVFPWFPDWLELLFTMGPVGGLMVIAAFPDRFKKKKPKDFLQSLISAQGCLLVSAGLLNGCLSFVRGHFFLSDPECLVLTGLICLLAEQILRCRYLRKPVGKRRYSVRLYYRGKEKDFLALVDSGNRLRVPDSKKPVSLISYRDCAGFCDTVSGGFYIPYHAVGTEKGMLFTVFFEKMEIQGKERTIAIEKPAVAIVKEPLSVDGDFSMILPEEYVPEE